MPYTIATTPFGAAAATTLKDSCDVAGCEGCALSTTGQPAAMADAVSPPRTEKANGKLLDPKTATGPSGLRIRRRSGRGPMGVSAGGSMATSR
jgi:hypothetical protein